MDAFPGVEDDEVEDAEAGHGDEHQGEQGGHRVQDEDDSPHGRIGVHHQLPASVHELMC
jgi:hypothetical protein